MTGASSNRRFIPTCVGNTPNAEGHATIGPVHPHVRGEYTTSEMGMFKIGGSSPRAWGIRRSTSWTHTRLPVHPHVRGEYIAARAAQLGQHGSSPRAWGIHISLSHRMDSVRFIPTCVGNTHPPARARIAVSVHPHVRGEYTLAQHGRIGQDGSSPRAWGIPTASCYGTSPPRFIPTCVGNTAAVPG